MNRDPDETLVERCRDGDRSALAALVTRYQRAIYNAAYRVVGNGEDAADVAQSVFLKVAERLDDFDASLALIVQSGCCGHLGLRGR